MNQNNYGGQSTGFFTSALTVAFVVLKLCKVIDWSWWWVLSPIWIPLAIVIVVGIVWLIYQFRSNYLSRKRFNEWREKMRNS